MDIILVFLVTGKLEESFKMDHVAANPEADSSMQSERKVDGVPEVAHGKFRIEFCFPTNDQTIHYNIDKAFGLVKTDNSVLKFRLIVTGTWDKDSMKLKNKFVYLSDEAMTCHIQMYYNYEGGELIGEKTTKDCMSMEGDKVFEVEKVCNYFGYRFVIRIGQDLDTQAQSKMNPNYANKYKDLSSSDFLVKCEDSIFPVHQWILKDRSEYFASIMRNDCQENENNELKIEDFKPHIVDMLLRYIYNGTVKLPAYGGESGLIQMTEDVSDLMQIADKYVLRELADACDSYLAQWYACKLKFFATEDRDFMNYYLRFGVKTADKLQAKKWAAAIFQWILNERSIYYEELWSSLLYEFPNFAILAANLAVKKNYQDWVRQHETWSFDTLECIPTVWNWSTADWRLKRSGNSIAIITGKFGEMKGAVQC